MAPAPLQKVRWLTIAELAERWAPELGIPREIVERELRISFLTFRSFAQRKGLLQNFPQDDELPPVTERLDRQHVQRFCKKQQWPLPNFWFEQQTDSPSFPGRPSIMGAILEELQKRAERGETQPKIGEEAVALAAWGRENFPGQQTPTPRAVENGIRPAYRQLSSFEAKNYARSNGS